MNALVLISTGQHPLLAHCLASIDRYLDVGWFDHRVIVDDSGMISADEAWTLQVPQFETIAHPHPAGLAAAVRSGWAASDGADFVFHMSEDFVLTKRVPLGAMRQVLRDRPNLAQLALRSQKDTFSDAYCPQRNPGPWLMHRQTFSRNPSLIPAWVTKTWPDTNEAGKTEELLASPNVELGIWGPLEGTPDVHHIELVNA